MDENSLIDLLEELAQGFGVKIRYEAIKQNDRFGSEFQNVY
jgi:hypothetical protein